MPFLMAQNKGNKGNKRDARHHNELACFVACQTTWGRWASLGRCFTKRKEEAMMKLRQKEEERKEKLFFRLRREDVPGEVLVSMRLEG